MIVINNFGNIKDQFEEDMVYITNHPDSASQKYRIKRKEEPIIMETMKKFPEMKLVKRQILIGSEWLDVEFKRA